MFFLGHPSFSLPRKQTDTKSVAGMRASHTHSQKDEVKYPRARKRRRNGGDLEWEMRTDSIPWNFNYGIRNSNGVKLRGKVGRAPTALHMNLVIFPFLGFRLGRGSQRPSNGLTHLANFLSNQGEEDQEEEKSGIPFSLPSS